MRFVALPRSFDFYVCCLIEPHVRCSPFTSCCYRYTLLGRLLIHIVTARSLPIFDFTLIYVVIRSTRVTGGWPRYCLHIDALHYGRCNSLPFGVRCSLLAMEFRLHAFYVRFYALPRLHSSFTHYRTHVLPAHSHHYATAHGPLRLRWITTFTAALLHTVAFPLPVYVHTLPPAVPHLLHFGPLPTRRSSYRRSRTVRLRYARSFCISYVWILRAYVCLDLPRFAYLDCGWIRCVCTAPRFVVVLIFSRSWLLHVTDSFVPPPACPLSTCGFFYTPRTPHTHARLLRIVAFTVHHTRSFMHVPVCFRRSLIYIRYV